MKKKILTLILVFGLWTSFAFSNTLEYMEARALLDAQNGMTIEELEENYLEEIALLEGKDEYTFTFPKSIGECLVSINIENLRYSSTENILVVPTVFGLNYKNNFEIKFFLKKNTRGLIVFFEYDFQKKIESDIYTYTTRKKVSFDNILQGIERDILEIPEDCIVDSEIKSLSKK